MFVFDIGNMDTVLIFHVGELHRHGNQISHHVPVCNPQVSTNIDEDTGVDYTVHIDDRVVHGLTD
jgi:hypothetical protein